MSKYNLYVNDVFEGFILSLEELSYGYLITYVRPGENEKLYVISSDVEIYPDTNIINASVNQV